MTVNLVPLTLVPVEVFGGDCDCHMEAGHSYVQPEGTPPGMTAQEQASGVVTLVPKCPGWGYGLMDAVSSWSDCNRASGRIYRVDEPGHREPGETVTVYVPVESLPWFERRFGDNPDELVERRCHACGHMRTVLAEPDYSDDDVCDACGGDGDNRDCGGDAAEPCYCTSHSGDLDCPDRAGTGRVR